MYGACSQKVRRDPESTERSEFEPAKEHTGRHSDKKIQALYRIEREAEHLSDEQRRQVRQSRSVPLLEELRHWLDENLFLIPPKSALGKAMRYLDKRWDKLIVYASDGRLRIDNNLVENSIRPFVIGGNSWLFANSVAGANASANLYSLAETARTNGLEPYAYLKIVLTELPAAKTLEDIERLLPYNQAETQRAATLTLKPLTLNSSKKRVKPGPKSPS